MDRPIIQKDIEGTTIKLWQSATEASKEMGVSVKTITNACSGKNRCRGFLWSYYVEIIPNEEWKELIIQNTIIQVSSHGRIRLANKKVTYGCTNSYGYQRISVKGKKCLVHRLVCRAFNPNHNYLNLQVNHIDRTTSNNNILNLEWCTPRENAQHERRTSKRDMRKIGGCRRVRQLTKSGEIVSEYYSMAEAFRITGVQYSNISRVCRGKQIASGGYLWEYC